ncbi:MAG: radical SAM protein [Deltaproteobacteria bacterium]|nr:radical SAM protein [Deltaproteobacteria bacterium]
MKPAVTLISPGLIRWSDVDFGLPHLVALGGYLERSLGVRVEILDLAFEGGDHRALLRTLESLGPHLVIGISCYSSFDYLRVMSLARFLKKALPAVPLVAGGYHASALPGDLVFEGSPFDAVVVGEGERPMKRIVERLLGGAPLPGLVLGPENIEDLDELPPYQWSLLDRYWPRATQLGKRFQIYLSRGCPYHCAFCMERAKTEYRWRAFSAERALDELSRLAKHTPLGRWIVNVADPLFGFKRSWRRSVLEGVIRRGLVPQQFWTLTRTDELEEEDIALLARARFSIGIGAESGSPRMLGIMEKTRDPAAYLAALERVATLAIRHDLSFATNVIVGHPGETLESMRETREFVARLFLSAPKTQGWFSIDPFRLYPGALIHERMRDYSLAYGTTFHQPEWWKRWADASFLAEHISPSHGLDYATRVREMVALYGPLVDQIQTRFVGQGRPVDRVFKNSLAEQRRMLGTAMRDQLLAAAERAQRTASSPSPRLRVLGQPGDTGRAVDVPVGLERKDADARQREWMVRALLDQGILRTERLIAALLTTPLAPFFTDRELEAFLSDRADTARSPRYLGARATALALEALEPPSGGRVLLGGPKKCYASAVLRTLLGDDGELICAARDPTAPARGRFDRVWILGALPARPPWLTEHLADRGRFVGLVGPRFTPQDLVLVTRESDRLTERTLVRAMAPALAGKHGWIAA